jgi:two-component system OmpR family response regulator
LTHQGAGVSLDVQVRGRHGEEGSLASVLVVDDDGHIREVVRFALEKAGHRVIEAADGRAALEAFEAAVARAPIEVVVLDIVMPELDGLEVCRRLREKSRVPILFLSSRDEELDRVLGLELGADDYVTKPFSPRELVARVKAMLRRAAPAESAEAAPKVLRNGPLQLDPQRYHCYWDGHEILLTVTEFALLQSLLGMPGKVYTRDELVDRAWGLGHAITDRTVDSHIRRIRKKFAQAGADPIETVYGLGYRLKT